MLAGIRYYRSIFPYQYNPQGGPNEAQSRYCIPSPMRPQRHRPHNLPHFQTLAAFYIWQTMKKTMISIILPALNEENIILRCLNSISKQKYPRASLEVILADANSSDRTTIVARRWSQREKIRLNILTNRMGTLETGNAEYGKAQAIQNSNGEFICLLDADNEIVQCDWLTVALRSFDLYPDIFGFESHYLPAPGGPALNNFLTACLHIDDPLSYSLASRPIEQSRIILGGNVYRKFLAKPVYPTGANGFIFSRKAITEFIGMPMFEESQVSLMLELKGQATFCMVDGYGIHHHYVRSWRHLAAKKKNRACQHLTRVKTKHTWICAAGRYRLYLHVLLNLSIIHSLLFAVYKSLRQRSSLWMYWFPSAIFITTVYILNFCRNNLNRFRRPKT
ncbi:MAG: glycosyltransferase family 2 protein [Kiritimatiellia bacterium]